MAVATSIIGTALITSPTVVASVGTNLIIGTIATTASSIGSLIKYLTTNTSPGINDILTFLASIDLEFTIGIVEQVVKELDQENISESLNKAIIGVNEILTLIHQELTTVKAAIEEHNSKYFNGWRAFKWTGTLDNIKKHNEIFKHRYGILFELVKIANKH
ncbi:hypothetical protein Klosneuvirus_1_251 [Klosneuvirus KNV1]|uniref:Uncharacterized protein n=1 Tax=Klosneuvirus KNV1 TaxID=1977640 RepID=A0A1V0SIC6_9VIRU|nr:hypothetical protein Klosneuvirus_1_251 [Klosneuvirus KNV1]